MKKKLSLLLITVMVVLTACGQSKDANSPSATANNAASESPAVEKTTLILGTSADYAPFEFHKTIDGKDTIIGFDIEIAKEIAKDMNAELEIQDMDFDGLLLALDTGKVDMVISGLTPTEERKKNVDFSEIYYLTDQGVLVSKDAAEQFKTLDDLKGKKIGIQKGSIQEGIAQEIADAKLTALGKIPELVMELKSGRVDAIILEKPVADQYAVAQTDIVVSEVKIEQPEEEAGVSIAVKKGEQELLNKIDGTIARLKSSGAIDQFVVEANELVGE
ncbi:polar amino acid transport system substrate-binding protein [Paenibacillus endophyticus]|uniref:Polar amino acid transport system substrate-binding protein n=1 Tax=Paenibacillus endophyticus TaxID=1294268 RepID=A0A7W5GBI9_9BACL|nr:transporter substrate-binding domain-containing protein [Paenibacillus endophyticus]MBB3153443.1 polar amino acid transport system substrate-binding protein [Paenibacillus endophyticus]